MPDRVAVAHQSKRSSRSRKDLPEIQTILPESEPSQRITQRSRSAPRRLNGALVTHMAPPISKTVSPEPRRTEARHTLCILGKDTRVNRYDTLQDASERPSFMRRRRSKVLPSKEAFRQAPTGGARVPDSRKFG